MEPVTLQELHDFLSDVGDVFAPYLLYAWSLMLGGSLIMLIKRIFVEGNKVT